MSTDSSALVRTPHGPRPAHVVVPDVETAYEGNQRRWSQLSWFWQGTDTPPPTTLRFFHSTLFREYADPFSPSDFAMAVDIAGRLGFTEQRPDYERAWRGLRQWGSDLGITPDVLTWRSTGDSVAAWEQVAQLRGELPLPATITASTRTFVHYLRYGIVRYRQGRFTLPDSPHFRKLAIDLFERGTLPTRNTTFSLDQFYDYLFTWIDWGHPHEAKHAEILLQRTLRDALGWNTVPSTLSDAERILLEWSRLHVLTRYRGDIPWGTHGVYPHGRVQHYLDTGELPTTNTASGSLCEFRTQLLGVTTGENAGELAVGWQQYSGAMRARLGWHRALPDVPPAARALQEWMREGILEEHAGSPPKRGADGIESGTPLDLFLRQGLLPRRNRPQCSLRHFYDRVLHFGCGTVPARRETGHELVRRAIHEQREWNGAPLAHTVEATALLYWYRNRLIDRFGGELPYQGEHRVPATSPLRRDAATGAVVQTRTAKMDPDRFFAQVLATGAGPDPVHRASGRQLIARVRAL